MSRALALGSVLFVLMMPVSAAGNGYSKCDCDEDGFWSIESILGYQKVADFLIAVAYFSIPVELIYFVSCSNVPFKWVLFQFIAFIVFCGMNHLLSCWAYGPHGFQLSVAITVFKFLAALVSSTTAVTLLTLFPMLLRVKAREFMLKKKTWDLDREVGIIKNKSEAGYHVWMLTQEIRNSLDRHTILYTTLFELSKTLDLQNCAVWMPNENRTEMILTHELKGRNRVLSSKRSILYSEPDVKRIKESDGVRILSHDSSLSTASSDELGEPGAVAAIRMPMLRVANFNGGTPELIKACYAILVLVLPHGYRRFWTNQELEIINVVADQVSVAISHAAILEESQLTIEKLMEQNYALQQAKEDALMASQARNSFQKVMSCGMRKPMHSICGLLSLLKDEKFKSDQNLTVETMAKASDVLSVLIEDLMMNDSQNGGILSGTHDFRLHTMIKEAGCIAKCLCAHNGFDFVIDVESSLSDLVVGDERRVFQVILHMVGNLLDNNKTGGTFTFQVLSQQGSHGINDPGCDATRSNSSSYRVNVRFEVKIVNNDPESDDSAQTSPSSHRSGRRTSDVINGDISFSMCQKLVQWMGGNIWVVPNPRGFPQHMALVLPFHRRLSMENFHSEFLDSSQRSYLESMFNGLHILLVDDDDMNKTVTRKLLKKLGCEITAVSSGSQCLDTLGRSGSGFELVIFEIQLSDMNGFELVASMRTICGQSCPLMIASSSNVDSDILYMINSSGIDGVIQKPFSQQGIVDELGRVLVAANREECSETMNTFGHRLYSSAHPYAVG